VSLIELLDRCKDQQYTDATMDALHFFL